MAAVAGLSAVAATAAMSNSAKVLMVMRRVEEYRGEWPPHSFYRECGCGVIGLASTFMANLTRSWLVWTGMSRQLAVIATLRVRGTEQEQEQEGYSRKGEGETYLCQGLCICVTYMVFIVNEDYNIVF
jgi:hypothetical protein